MKCNSLEEVREQIDQIDDAIIRLIAERGSYVVQPIIISHGCYYIFAKQNRFIEN